MYYTRYRSGEQLFQAGTTLAAVFGYYGVWRKLEAAVLLGLQGGKAGTMTSFFQTRGVNITPQDLSLRDWPQRAVTAGLTTIALHHASLAEVLKFVQSEAGHEFLATCQELGLQVEYEVHAMFDLLPRALFARDPGLFRMDEAGQRVADYNLCVHNPQAVQIVCDNAVAIGKILRPTTGRYFYYGDDTQPWCRCPQCRGFNDSEQAMILENAMVSALGRHDPRARLAHLAYKNTLQPPRQVKPSPQVFLEFAPITRRYDISLDMAQDQTQREYLEALDANLELFGRENAQVLEYWLDSSLASQWTRPARKAPWNSEVFARDVGTYGRRGIRHITTYAVYIDADYIRMYGEPPLNEYGQTLKNWTP